MDTRSWRMLCLAVILLTCAGCADRRAAWLRDETRGLEEMADLLATITDTTSFEAAKPKLKLLYDAQKKRRDELFGHLPVDERRRIWEEMEARPGFPKYEAAAKRYLRERDQLSRMPDVFRLLARDLILPSHGITGG